MAELTEENFDIIVAFSEKELIEVINARKELGNWRPVGKRKVVRNDNLYINLVWIQAIFLMPEDC